MLYVTRQSPNNLRRRRLCSSVGLSLIVRVRRSLGRGTCSVTSPAIESTRKDCDDREDVFVRLRLSGLIHCRVENQDFCEETGEKFERETGKSITVGNHNFSESSAF